MRVINHSAEAGEVRNCFANFGVTRALALAERYDVNPTMRRL